MFTAWSGETVVEYILRQMQDAFIKGVFKAGDKLPSEFDLMKQFNVSRNSLREAMKILSAHGIVNIKRGDGTYVSEEIKPSIIDVMTYSVLLGGSSSEDLSKLREVIEKDVLEFVIKEASDEELAEAIQFDQAMRECLDRDDLEEAGYNDLQFHYALVRATHNAFFSRMVQGMYALFSKSLGNNLKLNHEKGEIQNPHKKIIQCITTRDMSLIDEAIEDSLYSWKLDIKNKI